MREGRAFYPFEEILAQHGAPRSAADAYRIQDLVWTALHPGERPVAWKVGGPNDRVEPTAAPVLRLLGSPAAVAASDFRMIGVEAEVACRLSRGVREESEIATAISEIVVAIEVCDTRIADWKNAPELWKLADFQNNGALIAGSGTREWQAIDFTNVNPELEVNGKNLVANPAHPYGNPLRLLPWIVAHCAQRTGGLRAGDLVTTGSWGGMHLVEPPCEVVARFAGIGEARLAIEAR